MRFAIALFIARWAILAQISAPLVASSSPPDESRYSLKDAKPMNGIDPKQIGEFWNKWHLVTVRYRRDIEEQRFIYANPVAWRAMQSHAKTYPDGAMFAKIAFILDSDEKFPNSMTATLASRIQYMKKNLKRYPGTDGWGYALYLPDSSQGHIPFLEWGKHRSRRVPCLPPLCQGKRFCFWSAHVSSSAEPRRKNPGNLQIKVCINVAERTFPLCSENTSACRAQGTG